MIRKVISGGQTGADQAGLRAARAMGIETGGYIPRGFLTENGPTPELAEFGLTEMKTDKYPPRTFANARTADGTIRIAFDWNTRGELCTLRAINESKKPHLDIDLNNPPPVEEAASWVRDNNIQVLNVAGNRESTHPGTGVLAEKYLVELFALVNR